VKVPDVKAAIGDVPHMTVAQAERITDLVREHELTDILELGFSQGVSTCYFAGALEDLGRGRVTTIDLEIARGFEPNIEQLLERTGLRQLVEVHYEPTSYNWRLMKMLEEDPSPRFDLCYLDGAHDWYVDGLAFFLVDRLLRPGGWIVFDDLEWTYAGSPSMREHTKGMPEEELTTPQVRKVYELLVRTHPAYGEFRTESGWAFARKAATAAAGPREIVTEVVEHRYGLGAFALDMGKRARANLHAARRNRTRQPV
jgi:predicted O-methyltransferase YrrM